MLLSRRGKGFKCSLHDPLRADVNPRTRRHLPIHHQPGAFELVELLPIRPMPDQVRIGNQHPRRVFVGLEHAHRFAGLHQQGLVILQIPERIDDGMIGLPAPRRPPGAAVDHQIARPLSDLLVKIIHQHTHRRFLLPTLAGNLAAARGANRSVGGLRDFGFDRHGSMVVLHPAGFNAQGNPGRRNRRGKTGGHGKPSHGSLRGKYLRKVGRGKGGLAMAEGYLTKNCMPSRRSRSAPRRYARHRSRPTARRPT